MTRRLHTALVVEDDSTLRNAIAAFLRTKNMRVVTAASVSEALAQLKGRPDVVLLDVMLPDGDAFRVLEHVATIAPAPLRVAMSGEATPEMAFRLNKFGVLRYVQKPASMDSIWAEICAAAEETPDLTPFVQEAIHKVPLKDLLARVREVAIQQALAIARGNHTSAARLLQVTRQAVQQMLRPSR